MEEGEVVIGFVVAAGRDSSFGFQPGVGAFDGPAVARLVVAGLALSFSAAPDLAAVGGGRLAALSPLADAGFDPAFADLVSERLGVVAAVGPDLVGADTALGECVQQRQQVSLFVLVAGREAQRQRRPVRVYGEVVAAAGPALERARDLVAPFFASTSEASTITRDQSSLSASASSSSSTAIAAGNKPRRDHSSKRRRHVSPLGSPNSRYGSSSHGVSVNKTYKIPSRQARAQ